MSCTLYTINHYLTYHALLFFFFFNDTATTEIYTLSLHDALPISRRAAAAPCWERFTRSSNARASIRDRKSTRLNSSHANISYAVFCLKKKKNTISHAYKENRDYIGIAHDSIDLDGNYVPYVVPKP